MYPKVKVRAIEDDDEFDVPVRGFNSLSIPDSKPPEQESKHAASRLVETITNPPISRSATLIDALPKTLKKNKLKSVGISRSMVLPAASPKVRKTSEPESVDISRPHIRASTIPRPRAVISSPDNDQLLGTKNRTRVNSDSVLKTHTLAPSKQAPPLGSGKKPLRSVGERKDTAHTSDLDSGKGSAPSIRVRRASIVKAKPCFTIT